MHDFSWLPHQGLQIIFVFFLTFIIGLEREAKKKTMIIYPLVVFELTHSSDLLDLQLGPCQEINYFSFQWVWSLSQVSY